MMTLEQLVGKYARLRVELSAAYAALAWNTRHITRLDDELASTGRAITEAQPLDEQTSDSFPVGLAGAQEGAAEYRTLFGAGHISDQAAFETAPTSERQTVGYPLDQGMVVGEEGDIVSSSVPDSGRKLLWSHR